MNSKPPVPLRVDGLPRPLQLYVHGEEDKVISARLRSEGVWEPYETQLLLSMLSPGDVFVDVGANLGYFCVIAAALVGSGGAVHAFEPHPDNYDLLCANIRLNDLHNQVETYPIGLADEERQGNLFFSEDNSGDHQIYQGSEARSHQAIRLRRGCEVLRDSVTRLDLLKVDTQGSESAVVAGLMPLLRGLSRPPRVLIELTPHSLREAGSSGRELVQLLAQLKQPFWIIDHIEHRLSASTAQELALWCDAWEAVPESRGFINILVGRAP